jgi:hypothetical protein
LHENPVFAIEPVAPHWMAGVPPEDDLCVHAGVRVTLGDTVLLDTGDDEYAVSTGAFHLLRALSSDHTRAKPVAEHLIPHCGHFMFLDEESNTLVNLGCAAGVDWWVRHDAGATVLTFDVTEIRISRREWCLAVTQFCDSVMALYEAGAPKQPSDANDRTWYPVFQSEWRRMRTAASCS